jgi:cytoskeletal protein CcmA (bactofilin family)
MAESAKDRAIVGEDTTLSGRYRGRDLVVLGRLEAEVELAGELRVGRQGHVKGTVRAASVLLEGNFDGDARAETLTVAETARARGTFHAKRLIVREGALLEGNLNPAPPAAPEPPAPPAAAPAPAQGGQAPAPGGTPEPRE